MQERRSPSTADAEDTRGQGRARVLSPLSLLGLAACVGGALYLLFPKHSLIQQVQSERGNDQLTAGYIAALLRTEPANHELRLLLAEKRFAMGQFDAARDALEPAALSGDPLLQRRVTLLEYRILRAEAAALTPDTPARTEAQARLRSLLSRYAGESWNPQQLMEFARHARALGDSALAARFNARLATSELTVLPEWLAEAAQVALSTGDYAGSAQLYFSARHRADNLADRRTYFLKAVATLRSGNLLREALAAADREIGDLRDDEIVLAELARLALAAGDPARAQGYVRRMLRMSAREAAPATGFARVTPADPPTSRTSPAARPRDLFERALDWLVTPAAAAEAAVASTPARPAPAASTAPPALPASPALRPYDEPLYTLAFDVFLANGNVADAWRVADAAVAQRPNDIAWRRRLAQVSEWSGKSQDALRHWITIAKQSTGAPADEAWGAVLRLAPGLQDDEALLAAWQREAGRRALSLDEQQRVAGIYETLGRPADGVAFLNGQFARHANPGILDAMAALQERSGRIDDAIVTLDRLRALPGAKPDAAQALRLATLLFLRADFARAYRVLQDLRNTLPATPREEDAPYWKLFADLAWQLQDDAGATEAYGRLQAGGRASADDVERLVQLLRDSQPAEARRLAQFSWNQWRSMSGLLVALELANSERDYRTMKILMDDVRPEDEAQLEGNSFYYTLRAGYYQGTGDRRGAMAEYRRALQSRPADADLRLAYLWLLIDGRDPAERGELRQKLREWGNAGEAPWWDAYAAAHIALGEPHRALPWLSRQAAAHADDYLWLANYAETLEEAGQAGMAERVRRHAWIQARRPEAVARRAGDAGERRDALLAYTRLALRRAPGDGSLNAMRRLLREDLLAPARANSPTGSPQAATATDPSAANADKPAPERALDAAVSELLLAWSLGEEHIDAARQWMFQRFARRVESPAWADISLALAERDRTRLAELLDDPQRAAALPEAARIDAARELGRTKLARDLGLAALARQPDNDDIHLRLATDLLAGAASVIARDTLFERGALHGHEESVRYQAWATPQLRLAAEVLVYRQSSGDASVLTGVPSSDRSVVLSALWRHSLDNGETEAQVAERTGVGRFNSLRLSHTRPFDERLSGTFALSSRERATESVALGIGGHKNEASAALNWRISSREYLSARAWGARFHTQSDAPLGSGHGLSMEAGYRIRTEYPDFNVRLSRQASHFEAGDGSDTASIVLSPGAIAPPPGSFFMPQSFKLWGINAGFGTDLREQRSRAIRPYADFGRTVSSASGSGYNWLIGAGGSVLGPDHLSAYLLRARGGGIGAAVREFGLRYQLFFE
jgi:hypothetical protein